MQISISHLILSALILASVSVHPADAAPVMPLSAIENRAPNFASFGSMSPDLGKFSGHGLDADISMENRFANTLDGNDSPRLEAPVRDASRGPANLGPSTKVHSSVSLPTTPKVVAKANMDITLKGGRVTDIQMKGGDWISKLDDGGVSFTPTHSGKTYHLDASVFPTVNGRSLRPKVESTILRDPAFQVPPARMEVEAVDDIFTKSNDHGVTIRYDVDTGTRHFVDELNGSEVTFGAGREAKYMFADGSRMTISGNGNRLFNPAGIDSKGVGFTRNGQILTQNAKSLESVDEIGTVSKVEDPFLMSTN